MLLVLTSSSLSSLFRVLVKRKMSTSTFSSVAEQVKLDLLSKTHALDNVAKRKEVARNFVCELCSR